MTKGQKAAYIMEQLEKCFPEVPIPLNHSDPYTLLIAVLLSAQCTDERVNKITPKLFALASTPHKMAKLPVQEIQDVIRPCGLAPQKAKAIAKLSEILLDKHKGKVPESFEELEALPGVGHKTASVVMSQAFGVPAFPVDTHIHRLLTKWGIGSGKNVVETEQAAKKYFPEESWNKLHLQIIYYGRAYSPARNPKKQIDYITEAIGTPSARKALK